MCFFRICKIAVGLNFVSYALKRVPVILYAGPCWSTETFQMWMHIANIPQLSSMHFWPFLLRPHSVAAKNDLISFSSCTSTSNPLPHLKKPNRNRHRTFPRRERRPHLQLLNCLSPTRCNTVWVLGSSWIISLLPTWDIYMVRTIFIFQRSPF